MLCYIILTQMCYLDIRMLIVIANALDAIGDNQRAALGTDDIAKYCVDSVQEGYAYIWTSAGD